MNTQIVAQTKIDEYLANPEVRDVIGCDPRIGGSVRRYRCKTIVVVAQRDDGWLCSATALTETEAVRMLACLQASHDLAPSVLVYLGGATGQDILMVSPLEVP